MKRLTLLLLLTLLAAVVSAQAPAPKNAELPAHPSPEGVWVVLAKNRPEPGPGTLLGARLLRAAAGSNDFREVAVLRAATSLAELRELAGQATIDALRAGLRLPSDEAVWTFVESHPNLDSYGVHGLSMNLRRALGTVMLDASATQAAPGTRYIYRLAPAAGFKPEKAAVAAIKPLEKTVEIGRRSNLPRPRARRSLGRDSSVVVRWAARVQPGASTVFGRVYRQGPGERNFALLLGRLLVRQVRDSAFFVLEQRVEPEAMYRYYLEPLDFVGNPGPASDTAYVLSVTSGRMPLVQRATAHDTTTGIVLRWPALPRKAYLAGIEIQRSRDARGNYVRLDTIPAMATSYLDTRLLPNIGYHYRLRALLPKGIPTPGTASATAFASHQPGTMAALLAPVALTAEPEGEGVRLRWQPAAPDLTHDAYYVYRGTSAQDSLVVVSPPLRGNVLTFLDTTARNGRREYVYAVRDANQNMQLSPFSALAAARPNRAMPVTAPLGVSAYAAGSAVQLTWDDARRDPAVVAYRLYRRAASATAATSPARASDFTRLATDLVSPAYIDASVKPGQTYQYAVAAVDAQGTESTLSPVMVVRVTGAPLVPPGQLVARPVATGLEVSWSRPTVAPAKGYALYRRQRDQPTAQRVATLTAAQTRYLDQTAKPGTLYIYSLSALTPTAESARTPEISARR
ncbi:hypothetical protein HER32_14245 [Hymenobacter sp. BT18]|uniref:hypothetical protein n=1 Tax=Hymenobacter sp. BT18 TaxID=2835648 RepID=UPI00143E5FE0|nr:hypothetical protein [Hymenobacter sp. BT18]QIX62276.1 hypothetical protein HER32_14245 [Hymenobacter sp. BT18]